MADLRSFLDHLDRLAALADGVMPDQLRERMARTSRRIRARQGFLGETVVVALAGGTGSGKSSLINALSGSVVTAAGPRRPTTDQPLAWIPSDPEPGLTRLLDHLEISERVFQDEVEWLALIDLPDSDSVVSSHRATVDRLVGEVDAVCWVLDPEKYQDRALHDRYLSRLASHGERFVFVLNQIDRVSLHQRAEVIEDLARSLKNDGIDAPLITAVAADPPLGPPEGIGDLLDAFIGLGDAKQLAVRNALTEIGELMAEMERTLGPGSGPGFTQRWSEVSTSVSEALAGAILSEARREAGRSGAQAWQSLPAWKQEKPPGLQVEVDVPVRAIEEAKDGIDRFVSELADTPSAASALSLLEATGDIAGHIQDSARAVLGSGIELPERPSRARLLARGRVAAALLAAAGLAWSATALLGRQGPAIPLLFMALGLAGWLGLFWLSGRWGAHWAVREIELSLGNLTERLRRQIDARVGSRLRQVVRPRAELMAALTELSLLRTRWLGQPDRKRP